MLRLFRFFFPFALFLAPVIASAATLTPGDLIKGPGDTVYYYGNDGKRYVFPTLKTYLTWYSDFSSVKTVTVGELAALPIGGNVTYRPGVKLVKVATDQKVYAVSSRGTLRWVQTEAVAANLYGANWNTKVDDLPDVFFINYTVGTPIVNASDFSPAAQTETAIDINTDKKLTASPPPLPATSTSTQETAGVPIEFTADRHSEPTNDVITLTAKFTGGNSVQKIELFFDDQLIKTCFSIVCSGDAAIPTSGVKPEYTAEARVTKITTEVLSTTLVVAAQVAGPDVIAITLNQDVIKPGQAAGAVAEVIGNLSYVRIDISVNGQIVASCTGGEILCQWAGVMNGAEGTRIPVYSILTDSIGRKYSSDTVYLTLSNNDLPGVKITPAKPTIYVGEAVDITVTASDSDGIASMEILKDDAVIHRCTGAQPCTATTGPWNATGTLTFVGRAIDAKGASDTSPKSASVTVTIQ